MIEIEDDDPRQNKAEIPCPACGSERVYFESLLLSDRYYCRNCGRIWEEDAL
jgi:DNA-directed RNA polymerase subunit RPC12/RpoP